MVKCMFTQCCGCIELRGGCLIIGYLNLIGAILTVYQTAKIKVGTSSPRDENWVAINYNSVQDQLKKAGLDKDATDTALTTMVAVTIISSLALFAMSVVLLVGVHQSKRGHVKAFLVCNAIFLVICIISLFASFAQHPLNPTVICSLLFNIPLNVYFFLVIRSYYYKMNDGSRQPATNNTTV